MCSPDFFKWLRAEFVQVGWLGGWVGMALWAGTRIGKQVWLHPGKLSALTRYAALTRMAA